MLTVMRGIRRMRPAVLLLLLSPGVGGLALRSLHACPMAASTAAPRGEHAHHHKAPAAPDRGTDCQCLGPCHQAAPAAPGRSAPSVLAAEHAGTPAHSAAAADTVPSPLPLDRLPPPTAPPIA